jgi:hypothetical protein
MIPQRVSPQVHDTVHNVLDGLLRVMLDLTASDWGIFTSTIGQYADTCCILYNNFKDSRLRLVITVLTTASAPADAYVHRCMV